MKYVGSAQVSVVGLSHRFHTSADSNGAHLKTLASFLRNFQEHASGTLEVLLRRNLNIPADSNAMSVFVADLDEFSDGGKAFQGTTHLREIVDLISYSKANSLYNMAFMKIDTFIVGVSLI